MVDDVHGAIAAGDLQGATAAGERFTLSTSPLDPARLAESLRAAHAGAFVSFEGRVRNSDGARTVVALEYDAYPALSLAEGAAILREAVNGIVDARCVHRVGTLAVGDVAVWIGVIAAHRDEAFRACRFIIDEVKKRVPIWKKEHYADGSSEWVGLGGAEALTGKAVSPPAGQG
jgi:molybdopterin synthase catalytic subunit